MHRQSSEGPTDARIACVAGIALLLACCGRGGYQYAFEDDGAPKAKDADPNAPDADPNAPDADPNAPDADPSAPDANPNDPDAAVSRLVRQIEGDFNDAEETLSTGNIELQSFDLDLGFDNVKAVIVGMRFTGIDIPQGAVILSAQIQFAVDAADSDTTTLEVFAEDVDDAPIFDNANSSISARTKTAARTNWSPAAWSAVGEAGVAQVSPNLAPVMSEVVGRAGWSSGNSLVFLITGTGQRQAEAFDGSPTLAPILTVDFVEP